MRGRGHGAITAPSRTSSRDALPPSSTERTSLASYSCTRRERERRVQWCSPRGGPGTCASHLLAGPRRGRRRGTLRSSSRPRSCASTSDASISSWSGAPPGAGGAGPPQCSAVESSRRGPWASELPDDLWRRPGGDGPPWLRARPPRCSAPWSGAGGGLPAQGAACRCRGACAHLGSGNIWRRSGLRGDLGWSGIPAGGEPAPCFTPLRGGVPFVFAPVMPWRCRASSSRSCRRTAQNASACSRSADPVGAGARQPRRHAATATRQ